MTALFVLANGQMWGTQSGTYQLPQKWKSNGNKLILWTCRIGEALSNAVDWCRDYVLKFDAINDNLPEIVEYYGSNSRKVTCEWYIDDRSLLPNDVEA